MYDMYELHKESKTFKLVLLCAQIAFWVLFAIAMYFDNMAVFDSTYSGTVKATAVSPSITAGIPTSSDSATTPFTLGHATEDRVYV